MLYPAGLRYGAPETLLSDSSRAYSPTFEAVCRSLERQTVPIVSTSGDSDSNLMESHFHIQQRLFDSQFARLCRAIVCVGA